ncbi:MAG: MOSC domain-containing protein [Paracoccaceae bacterium]
MAARLTHIWRHPIKSHGREAVDAVTLEPGRTLPWDRVWAILHEAGRFDADDPRWVPCMNFNRGAKAPALMAITALTNEATGRITLHHPDRPTLIVNPDNPDDAARLVEWASALTPENRAKPKTVVRVPGRGMTDTDFPSVSINSIAALRALSQKAGRDIQMARFRGNFWIDGLVPWQEFEWIGQEISVGAARLAVRERITRCAATTANPETGRVDTDTLGVLEEGWGHRDFGVYAEVIEGGTVRTGDRLIYP